MAKKQKTQLPSEISLITFNGNKILGTIVGNTITGSPNYGNFSKYIKERESGELQVIHIGDRGCITIEPLQQSSKIELARLESLWTLAASKTDIWVTSQVFDLITKEK